LETLQAFLPSYQSCGAVVKLHSSSYGALRFMNMALAPAPALELFVL